MIDSRFPRVLSGENRASQGRREGQYQTYWPDRGRRDATVRSRSPITVADPGQMDGQAHGGVDSIICYPVARASGCAGRSLRGSTNGISAVTPVMSPCSDSTSSLVPGAASSIGTHT